MSTKPRPRPHKKVGRKLTQDGVYARDYGLTRRAILRLGGADKLAAMSEEARELLLGMAKRRRA